MACRLKVRDLPNYTVVVFMCGAHFSAVGIRRVRRFFLVDLLGCTKRLHLSVPLCGSQCTGWRHGIRRER